MIRLIKYTLITTLVITLAACGGKSDKGGLADKKAELEKLKKEQATTADKVKALEAEIAKMDTSSNKEQIAKLVGITNVAAQNFIHYIDLQGHVDADNISYISPRLGGGQVKALYVKKGDFVKKGQLLLKLDDALVKQQVSAAKQSLETIKTQLSFAKDLATRQGNLWKQGIGTEVQLLSAKNNVETLEKQLKGAEANIKTIEEQQSASNVYADVDGIADEVNVRVGEMFVGSMAGMAQIKIVNTNSLKVVTDVPENYASKVKTGSKVVVTLADLNKTYNTNISLSGKVINPNNRSFLAEAKLPYDGVLRPNQLAQVKIEDYNAANAIAIAVNTVQTDEKGKYVFVAVKEGDKLIAKKKQITIGEVYGPLVEVKTGLTAGEQLITEGYQSVYDGQSLRVDVK
jgi:membrane fusion protein, multidrug efflux system